MLIDSFTHCCSTHCVTYTRCRDVLQVRGQTIQAHVLLDETQGAVCVGQHVSVLGTRASILEFDLFMKNLLNIRLISLNLTIVVIDIFACYG